MKNLVNERNRIGACSKWNNIFQKNGTRGHGMRQFCFSKTAEDGLLTESAYVAIKKATKMGMYCLTQCSWMGTKT